MKIIETKEIMENDVVYIVETYDTGHVVKRIKPSEVTLEPVDPIPTESEIYQAEMLLMQAEILEKLNAMEV